jgi:hypothetical protein
MLFSAPPHGFARGEIAMRQRIIIAVIGATIVCAGIFVQGQTAAKQKPTVQPKTGSTPPAVSESFAKIALHALIAMRNSDGSAVAVGHIETLLEDMEVAQSTPTEEALTQGFGSINTIHSTRLENATLLRSLNKSAEQVTKDSGLDIDYKCFAAYEVRLKANDLKADLSNAPSVCLEKPSHQIFMEKTAQARAKSTACLMAAGSNEDAIESCATQYLSDLKSIGCSGKDEFGQFTCQQ